MPHVPFPTSVADQLAALPEPDNRVQLPATDTPLPPQPEPVQDTGAPELLNADDGRGTAQRVDAELRAQQEAAE